MTAVTSAALSRSESNGTPMNALNFSTGALQILVRE